MTPTWIGPYSYAERHFMTTLEVHLWGRNTPTYTIPAKLDTGSKYTFLPGIVTRPPGFEIGDVCKVKIYRGRAYYDAALPTIDLTEKIRAEGARPERRELFGADLTLPGYWLPEGVLIAFMHELVPPQGEAEYAIIGNDILVEHGKPFPKSPPVNGTCFSLCGYAAPVCDGACP